MFSIRFAFLVVICCTFLGITKGISQNWIVNHSFENLSKCPSGLGNFVYYSLETDDYKSDCIDWYIPIATTPDFFNSCSSSVPVNTLGYQMAQDGNGYVGIWNSGSISGMDFREYVQGKLTNPLIEGHRYYLNYWVSLAEMGSQTAINKLGGLLTDTPVEVPTLYSSLYPLYTAQVTSPAHIFYNDTSNWIPAGNDFIAEGGESWITLGSFLLSDEIDIQVLYGSTIDGLYNTYQYLDNVCLIDVDGTPSYTDTSILYICGNDSISINFSDASHFVYYWYDGTRAPSKSFDDTGIYWLKTIDLNQCIMWVDTFHILPKIDIALNLEADTLICANQDFSLNAYHPNIIEYKWNTGATTAEINITESGTYILEAKSHCVQLKDTIHIGYFDKPYFYLGDDSVICNSKAINLAPNDLRGNAIKYKWSNGSSGPSILVGLSGNYSLSITDVCNLKYSDSIYISFIDCKNCIQMPNAFSPNGDGLNDFFKPITNCQMDYFQMDIFNRFGELIFRSNDVNIGWDGTYKQQHVDGGVYFYEIRAKNMDQNIPEIYKKGDLTLIR